MVRKIDKLDRIKITCYCGGKTRKIKTTWKKIPVRGWKCIKCGEEILHPLDAEKARVLAKAIENNEFAVKIRRVGKSLIMTIPNKLAEIINIREGEIANWNIGPDNDLIVHISK